MINSRIGLITVVTSVLTAGGLMANQDTGAHRRQAGANRLDRMSAALNLTDQQKQQAKSIFMSEREAARPDRQMLREDRQAVLAAVQAGKPVAEVQQLAKNEGPALGNLAADRATAFAKFYAALTPDQQQKFASLHQERAQHPGKNNASRN